MTLKDLFNEYKKENNPGQRLIFCDFVSQDGNEIKNVEEFEGFLKSQKNQDCVILNKQQSNKFVVYDYFAMHRVEPYVVGLYHPLMTNAYWKETPDQIIDVVVNDDGIYRYLLVQYDCGVRDYIIEYPTDINSKLLSKSKKLFPEVFQEYNNNLSLSLVFTNGNRFTDIEENNFIIYNLREIYTDWDVKKISTLTLSKKVWNDLKAEMTVE